jgi:hypothetical protein
MPEENFVLLVFVMNVFSSVVTRLLFYLDDSVKCSILHLCDCCSVVKLLLKVTSRNAVLAHCTHPKAKTGRSLCCLAIDGE